jgi:hypothetical protein
MTTFDWGSLLDLESEVIPRVALADKGYEIEVTWARS